MKTLLQKAGLIAVLSLFALSCATTEKQYRVELIDKPDSYQEQEAMNTYEKFPYIDFQSSRL